MSSQQPRAIAVHARRADIVVKGTVLLALAWGLCHFLLRVV